MSDRPEKPYSTANDWINRAIVLVIALMCLIFGVPLVGGSALSFTTMIAAGEWPNPWTIVAFGIGLALCAFGVVVGWSALVPRRKA
ncbi:hypothetical protein [Maricaulis sp.]|uniref:hypothetical protein n=1 Tax=Maricaulis sp. TaxID=1486257 RepID=UPI0026392882|nr:hypothetical protein [Maricaulis sp.]